MQIYLFNKFEQEGGAARAAKRLHLALVSQKINSQLFVDFKSSDSERTIGPLNKLQKLVSFLKTPIDHSLLNILYPKRFKYPWGLNWFPFPLRIPKIKSDSIFHLHWVSFGTISWLQIARLKSPIVWTMHDMWAMTGGCHYTYGCEKFQTQCHSCPQLKSKFKFDLSYLNFHLKKILLKKTKIHVVCCSNWLAECFRKSDLFQHQPICVIPNPIDQKIYSPIPMSQARDILNFPQDKKIILLSAMSAANDPRKGMQYLNPMLKKIEEKFAADKIMVVIAGSEHSHGNLVTPFESRFMGQINDDISMALIYSAADLSVAPSTQENLSNSVMESMACGTPVLAFKIGGMPDLIKEGFTGELANPFDSKDLGDKACIILKRGKETYQESCIEHVSRNYAPEIVAKKYVTLYEKILNEHKT